MADFSLLDDDDVENTNAEEIDGDIVDEFVKSIKGQGVVTSNDQFKDQRVKAPEETKTETIDNFEVQYGYVFNDFMLHFNPSKNSLRFSNAMAKQRNLVIMTIVRTLAPLVPQDLRVDINEPADDWDLQLWSVKMGDARLHLNFDENDVISHLPTLVKNIGMAALGKDPF